VCVIDSSKTTRSGPGLISTMEDESIVKSLMSSPQGPVLMPVEGDRGTGQFHRECACDVLMDRAMMKSDGAVRNAVDELVGAMMINVEMLCLDGKRESNCWMIDARSNCLTQSRRRWMV
jgi:hypothetical protein